jgi:hypothetical protein
MVSVALEPLFNGRLHLVAGLAGRQLAAKLSPPVDVGKVTSLTD